MPDNRKPLMYGAFPVCRNYTVRAYLRDHGAPKRRGRKNGVLHAGPLLGRLYAGHLRPCDHRRTAQSRPDDGQYPIPCRLTVFATHSRWGQRLGQKKRYPKIATYEKQKSSKSDDFEDFWQATSFWISCIYCSKQRYFVFIDFVLLLHFLCAIQQCFAFHVHIYLDLQHEH